MLRRLSVENYALIEKLEMELDPHLNIITGETGAGKSILLGALGLLLGAKNDGSAMKDAARNCVVEGTFDLSGRGMKSFFDENDLDYAPETHVTRMITPAGKSRAFINDIPVQLAQLREFGTRLIDIHSQHQNLILSSEEFRTSALDTVAGNGGLLAQYTAQYARLSELRRQLAALREAAADGRRDEEWLRFQCEELTAANLREGEQAATEKALHETEQKAAALADRLHKAREKAAAGFAKQILATLTQLGMPDTVFEVALTPLAELGRTGRDNVVFLFTANRSATPQPVERIASGGELSRVMLALKALLARCMQLPTVIFDEIDTGVSGRIADAMGEIIESLSATMQVVDITHLPQVASKGSAHFVVYKQDGRTGIRRLTAEERITEIAKMLSGSRITDAAVAQARILLGK